MRKVFKNFLATSLCSIADMMMGLCFIQIGLITYTGDIHYSLNLDIKMYLYIFICCYLRRKISILTNHIVEVTKDEEEKK